MYIYVELLVSIYQAQQAQSLGIHHLHHYYHHYKAECSTYYLFICPDPILGIVMSKAPDKRTYVICSRRDLARI